MAGRPLRPAIDRRLGEPLPPQLANQSSAAPSAPGLAVPGFHPQVSCGISHPFGRLSPTNGHVPMYYSPVRHSPSESKLSMLPFDLHVLGMPPAFNLSQDQTLHLNPAFWSYSNHSQKLTEINLNHFFGLKSEYFRFFAFPRRNCIFQKHPHLSVRLFQIFKERLLPFRRRQGCVYYTTVFRFASPSENFLFSFGFAPSS